METVILIVAAFITSSISAVLGMGGGIILLGIMALIIPEGYIVVALHGIVQLISNLTRTFVFRNHIRKDIIKRKPNVEDLIDGTITVSAMDHTDVSRFIPIIHPKQSAVLAVPKIQTRNEIDEKGLVSNNRYVNLGMSFDHSFLDANQANVFLGSLIEEMRDIVNAI